MPRRGVGKRLKLFNQILINLGIMIVYHQIQILLMRLRGISHGIIDFYLKILLIIENIIGIKNYINIIQKKLKKKFYI